MMKEADKSKSLERNLPDFLCIGAMGSGTSWLNKNLGFHPEVWFTPIKELHHFDAQIMPRERKRVRYFKHLRRRFRRLARKAKVLDPTFMQDLSWDAHFFLRRRTNDWYVRLFRPMPGQIAGEITPAYAGLSVEKIREVHELNPKIKLIYIMRNPIDRSWTAVTKILAKRKKRTLSNVPDKEIFNKLDSSKVVIRSNYIEAIEKWGSVFPKEQFFITFFEDIAERPRELLLRIHEFLGITVSEEFISSNVSQKVNPSGKYKSPIPVTFQIYLAEQQIHQLRDLSRMFSGPADEWLERAEKILERAEVDK